MSEGNTDAEVAHLTEDQQTLYRAMSDISEDCWYAGWLHGNEFHIWNALQSGELGYGLTEINRNDLDTVKALSEKVGGWIVWRDDEHGLPLEEWGPYFVPMDEWLAIVNADKAARAQIGDLFGG